MKKLLYTVAIILSAVSCNYLSVVPPEQPTWTI